MPKGVEPIVEKFADMQGDLDKERKMMTKQWAKREEQIRCAIDATAGMYGDLQGIARKSLQEIEALEDTMPLAGEVQDVRRTAQTSKMRPVRICSVRDVLPVIKFCAERHTVCLTEDYERQRYRAQPCTAY
jgi:hypothetical protein